MKINTKKTLLNLALLTSLLAPVHANDMVPSAAQSEPILFTNATLHTVTDGVIKNGDLLIENGKILAIGNNLVSSDAAIIDLSGKHVFPGIVALDTSIGLVEVSAVKESDDRREIGAVNPQLSVTTAYNADSEVIPTVRHNGIAYAQVVPSGNGLAGQSALVNLDAWNIDDALYPTGLQMHLYWPQIRWPSSDEKRYKKQQEQLNKRLNILNQSFEDSYRFYIANKKPSGDQALASMMPLFAGEGQLYIHADTQSQIEQAISLARKYDFKIVIVGGYDAWRSAVALNEIGAKVIYTNTLGLPKRRDEPIDQAFKIPSLLKQTGVAFALGYSSSWDSRNLPFAAGQTVSYGLTKQEALKAITLDAAKIMNVDNLGALSKGYKASFIISNGDILDPSTAKVEQLYIEGRKVDLNNRQQQLYQKYLKR
ncbi:amidohydrolase [Parashewanella spongiae]|uniref:Amidohydrolase n=2 Tax=Parashewanella spongiae TaxID=342950 RepID=A0A3A6U0Q2_9GAMM|nr:amidohydrolase family protein [Parashewanella spongiae]MCL1079638.1 amidohydrolase family protein [Parashewanella spongiae]RJY19077.1 amidohydrolase [Parashewanella spongiae]